MERARSCIEPRGRRVSPDLQRFITLLVDDAKTPQLYNMFMVWMNLVKLEQVCLWLVRNHITGYNLHSLLVDKCEGSPLQAASWVLQRLEKGRTHQIIYTLDWLP